MRQSLSPVLRRFAGSIAGVAALAAVHGPVHAATLTAAEIGPLISGAVVHIDTPIGTPLRVTFHADGSVEGASGKLAFYLGSARDRGRWWLSQNKLCQKWMRWFDGETSCLSLWRSGNGYAWQRDDGRRGTASIVSVGPPVVVAAAKPELPPPSGLGGPPVASVPVVDVVPRPVEIARPVAQRRDAIEPWRASVSMPASRSKAAMAPALRSPARPTLTYRVVNVRQDDQLNIRRGPSARATIVSAVPHDGHQITLRGQCLGDWCPIRYGRASGWVNRTYLELEPLTGRATVKTAQR